MNAEQRADTVVMRADCCRRPPFAALAFSPDNDDPDPVAPYVVCRRHLKKRVLTVLRNVGHVRVQLIDGPGGGSDG